MPIHPLSQGNIYLLGFMGSGKSAVGRLMARRVGQPFLDTDACIERETGMTITDIFRERGETVFREMEKLLVLEVSRLSGHIVSLGGGTVVDPGNWERITESGLTITLAYPAEVIKKRLADVRNRPLLGETGPERERIIEMLVRERTPLYERADLVLRMNRTISVQRIAETLIAYLGLPACDE